MDYVQASGRAGRSGNWAKSWVYVSHDKFEKETSEDLFGYEIMRKWVTLGTRG